MSAQERVHELKTWPEYFAAVVRGTKPFEIRFNDREFAVGDTLVLREFIRGTLCTKRGPHDGPCDAIPDRYTGREATARVTYLTDYEQRPGYVVLGIAPVVARFDCEDCGRDVRVDEDWCCRTCGRDALAVDAPKESK